MSKENSLGVRSIDMLKIAYKCIQTAIIIEEKHNRDNTEQTKNLCEIENEIGNILKREGVGTSF